MFRRSGFLGKGKPSRHDIVRTGTNQPLVAGIKLLHQDSLLEVLKGDVQVRSTYFPTVSFSATMYARMTDQGNLVVEVSHRFDSRYQRLMRGVTSPD